LGKKSKSKTAKKKAVKKAAKSKGKKLKLKDATKIVNKSEKLGIDIPTLATDIIAGVPIVGPLASTLVGAGIEAATGAGAQGERSRGGLVIVDTRTGMQLRRISMEDYFYLKSLKRRRQLFRAPRRKQVAIIRSGETVVKV